ncbi:MAG: hypothetical protein WC867_03465 [Candidatus Pacearchaeota archaeon]|jgi:hypothetical protein
MKTVNEINYESEKIFIKVFLIGLFIIFSISLTSALTANIGNARMILRPNIGETIDRTILVNNTNSEAIEILIVAKGDLENVTKIIDNKFTLQPGQSKDARFTMKVIDEGTFETQLMVKFTSLTDGTNLGLAATIIVIPDKNGIPGDDEPIEEEPIEDPNEEDPTQENTTKMNPFVIGGIITMLLFVVLLVLLVLSNKRKRSDNKEERRDEIKPKKRVQNK